MSLSPHATAAHPPRPPVACLAPGLGDYLAFQIGTDEYGIDIERVQAIRSYEEPARLRNAPAFIKGAINLCGAIVPVVDLRLRFNLAPVVYDRSTVVIVLDIGRCAVGLVVDSVSDVTPLAAGSHGLAHGSAGNRTLRLLDIDTLLSDTDIRMVAPTLQ